MQLIWKRCSSCLDSGAGGVAVPRDGGRRGGTLLGVPERISLGTFVGTQSFPQRLGEGGSAG